MGLPYKPQGKYYFHMVCWVSKMKKKTCLFCPFISFFYSLLFFSQSAHGTNFSSWVFRIKDPLWTCWSLSHSLIFFVFLISSKIKVLELTLLNKNISRLNMFTFDVFSVCHSLGQSVMGITLYMFVFWLIPFSSDVDLHWSNADPDLQNLSMRIRTRN